MSKRYDASTPREYEDRDGNTKTAWSRVGRAFEKDGRITVLLDVYPLPSPDGSCKIILMEPRERSEPSKEYPNYNRSGASGSKPQRDLDDDVPF